MAQQHARARLWLLTCIATGTAWLAAASPAAPGPEVSKVMVIGFDGMDPLLAEQWMAAGELPSFKKLRETGDYRHLGTSVPPQSPVAWADFITGQDAGGHGIFDFIHRDPATYLPLFSMTRISDPRHTVTLGDWILPLDEPKLENLRHGRAFWQILEEHGVHCSVLRAPSNFPPVPMQGESLSGMGTQDLQGTPGFFSFYTTQPGKLNEAISGGAVFRVAVADNRVAAELPGPKNAFRNGAPMVTIPFEVFLDGEAPVAKVAIQDHHIILREGEWSAWVQLEYELIPHLAGMTGIAKFFLKQVRPVFELYVTPINIDPSDPAMPISTPDDFSAELARDLGLFYTQGMAEDTKALQQSVFTDADFVTQANAVRDESMQMLRRQLAHYESGFFFFYFSSLDLNSHMFWRTMDPSHPAHNAQQDGPFAAVIRDNYRVMDEALGLVLTKADADTVVIAMSDHGFAPYARSIHLNKWLHDEGYLAVRNERRLLAGRLLNNVRWSRTRMYGLGLNGLYVNQQGREAQGTVPAGEEKQALLREVAEKLLALRDPQTGAAVVGKVFRSDEAYHGDLAATGPDLVVGFNRGYRLKWESALGQFLDDVFSDNTDKWSGDHLMDPEQVPGVLFANRKIAASKPKLVDVTATILELFGITVPAGMTGRPIM